jgi:hypothetical protein
MASLSLAYVAGIHVLLSERPKTWMAGSSPAMATVYAALRYNPSTALVMMLRWISFDPP